MSAEQSLVENMLTLLRRFLGGRRRLIVVALAVLAAGAYFNWSWLVAAGIAPLLLAIAPCAVMCALGLCMMEGRPGAAASKPDGAGVPPILPQAGRAAAPDAGGKVKR